MNENIPWVEKYRPTQFDNIVLDSMNRTIFENILSTKYFPNLLFYGPPGTGKTTTIINLINTYQQTHYKIDRSLIIHLNASDERGIDIVRNQINTFVKSNCLFETGIKFVILDEVDYMTKSAQQAFKYLLQSCNDNVKFCLICNYISKVDESLKNEFICIRFNQLPPSEIHDFVQNIALKENLKLNKTTIEAIQKIYRSDIRSIINFIQLNQYLDYTQWTKSVLNNSIYEHINKILVEQTSEVDIIKYIHNLSIQYNKDIKTLLLNYFDYIIRNKREQVNTKMLTNIKCLIHNSEIKDKTMLANFCALMRG
jgi:replication factor C subunit 3/5